MKCRRKAFTVVLMLVMCFIVSAPASAKVKINKKSATLNVGQTLQLKVSGTASKVKWSSSKKSVVIVTSNGKVTAKKKGTGIITAKVGKKSYKCKITVKNIKLSKSNLKLDIGEHYNLNVSGSKSKIKWLTSNKKVATVNSKGNIVATGCGICNIYASVSGVKLTCKVNVAIEDPECFPNRTLKIGDVTINSFEAKFVSYQIYRNYSKNIAVGDGTYFFPYKYHIKITGKTKPNSSVRFRFCFLTNGSFPDMPANNMAGTVSNANGKFVLDEDVNFSTYGEMIYIVSAY